jgi:hypothetical protein
VQISRPQPLEQRLDQALLKTNYLAINSSTKCHPKGAFLKNDPSSAGKLGPCSKPEKMQLFGGINLSHLAPFVALLLEQPGKLAKARPC